MHWVCFHHEFEHEAGAAGVSDGDPDQVT